MTELMFTSSWIQT